MAPERRMAPMVLGRVPDSNVTPPGGSRRMVGEWDFLATGDQDVDLELAADEKDIPGDPLALSVEDLAAALRPHLEGAGEATVDGRGYVTCDSAQAPRIRAALDGIPAASRSAGRSRPPRPSRSGGCARRSPPTGRCVS